MPNPFILINAKNYKTGIGDSLLQTLETICEVQHETLQPFSVAVNTLDLQMVSQQYAQKIDLFAQHCDDATFGASTGKILPEYLKQLGLKGVILNHSENRIEDQTILKNTITRAKLAGLDVVVCAETVEEGKFLAEHTTADYIAVEPPELIGGDISVSNAHPEIISESVKEISSKSILIGAGIKNKKDIDIVLKRGGKGVLLASGVMKANNIKEALFDLVR